jgi:GH15 family glucan-1,4-alpha-glucosidase
VVLAQNTKLPVMEMIFGPTASNAVVGNGGLTVGLSKYGEAVSMRWPCSNYYDQLNFATIHPVPAWNKVEWYDRHLNAKEFDGAYCGLSFTQNGKQVITWLRDKTWTATQSYLQNDAAVVLTKYVHSGLGLEIVCTDFVLPNSDVYCRNFKLEKSNPAISNIQLLTMSNMAMCNTLKPNDPASDWADDSKNGYVSFLDKDNDASVSFVLNESSARFKQLPTKSNVSNFANAVKTSYTKDETVIAKASPNLDVFCAISANKKAIKHYLCNSNEFKLTQLNKHKDYVAGNSITLSTYDLSLSENVQLFYSFAGSYTNSITQLAEAKSKSFESLLQATLSYWQQKMAKAKLPNVPDAKMKTTLQRILINTLLATNKGNGIGSSVGETQPPYTMIWVRDAAIMGYMLDCAGFTQEAEDNVNFIARTQRKQDGQDCRKPSNNECYKGTWSQCYFANGIPSWDYDFEVDEVGWGIWAMYTHSLFLEGQNKKAYLKPFEQNIIDAADFLVRFKDDNGLQKKAREDDLLWESQTILGASTTVIGLKSAIAALKIINPTHIKIATYTARLQELENAIIKEFWNSNKQELGEAVYGNFGPRGLIIWPAQFLPMSDNKMQAQAKTISKQMEPFFNKESSAMNKEWWYLGKATTAMAAVDNNETKTLTKQYLGILLKDVCTQDTYIYGETPMLRKNIAGKWYYDNRVGQPSNHPAAWIYMTAELLYGNTHPELYK